MTMFTIDKITQKDSTHTMQRSDPFQQQNSFETILPNLAYLQNEQSPFQPSSNQQNDDREASPSSSISSSPRTPGSQGVGSPGTDDKHKKPPHSYIALIAMAILNCPEKRLLLCDIYQYIQTKFPFYRNNDRSWRNSIRHNLSLNECFIKCGRSGDGRGNFWGIHPANVEDFARGDYRRRRARRRVRAAHDHLTQSYLYHPYSSPVTTHGPSVGFVPMTCTTLPPYPVSVPSASFYPQSPVSVPYTISHAMQKPGPYCSAPTMAAVASINSVSAPITSSSLMNQLHRSPQRHLPLPVSPAESPLSAFSSSCELTKTVRPTVPMVAASSIPKSLSSPAFSLPFNPPTTLPYQPHWERAAFRSLYST